MTVNYICGCGGIGRLIGFRFQRASVQVRVLSSAPNNKEEAKPPLCYLVIENSRTRTDLNATVRGKRRERCRWQRKRPERSAAVYIFKAVLSAAENIGHRKPGKCKSSPVILPKRLLLVDVFTVIMVQFSSARKNNAKIDFQNIKLYIDKTEILCYFSSRGDYYEHDDF